MVQLDTWNEFERTAQDNLAAARKTMFRPGAGGREDENTEMLRKSMQQQRAIWALVACGELAQAYPLYEDRLVITLCQVGFSVAWCNTCVLFYCILLCSVVGHSFVC